MSSIVYSVVIPIKDEKDNLVPLIDEVRAVMGELGKRWELICIDDGSTDGSRELLQKLQNDHPFLVVIEFDRNYGQTSAFDAGFKAAQGTFVITMDGDGQNDPKDIPKLLEKAETNDLVCGIRVNRRDSLLKKGVSKIANFFRSRLCQDGVKDTGCSLKVYRRSCLQEIKLFDGMHRFLPALFQIESYTVAQVPVNHRERTKGTSKYHFFNRLIKPILDMFAVYWMRRRRLAYKVKKHHL